eukprot:12145449-Ditylum_brightwellii.AAC.1
MGRESKQWPLGTLPQDKGGKGAKGQLELGELLFWPGKICRGIGALIDHASPPEDKEETIHEWATRSLGEE